LLPGVVDVACAHSAQCRAPAAQEVVGSDEIAIERVAQFARIGLVEEQDVPVEEGLRLIDFLLTEWLRVERTRQFVERRTKGEEPVLVLHRPDPDGEVLLVPYPAELRGSGVPAGLLEVFDVRVVAIVETALLAETLHQSAVELAVLTERAARDRERGPVVVASRERPRESAGDGARLGFFLH